MKEDIIHQENKSLTDNETDEDNYEGFDWGEREFFEYCDSIFREGRGETKKKENE
jgi:hypothetical protein